MELNEAARELIGAGADATLVTVNADGSPHATLVWVALQSTPESYLTRIRIDSIGGQGPWVG